MILHLQSCSCFYIKAHAEEGAERGSTGQGGEHSCISPISHSWYVFIPSNIPLNHLPLTSHPALTHSLTHSLTGYSLTLHTPSIQLLTQLTDGRKFVSYIVYVSIISTSSLVIYYSLFSCLCQEPVFVTSKPQYVPPLFIVSVNLLFFALSFALFIALFIALVFALTSCL